MALNPSPQRQAVVTFPTPNVGDILFFETVDAERIGVDVPEYGTKHPDREKWPNHRLVFVESTDEQNRFYRFYYAADQLDQDDDNWEHVEADLGNQKFEAVARTYTIRRSEYSSTSPAIGSAMADNPAGKFAGTFVLAERQQQLFNENSSDGKIWNGLYVIERRLYIKKTTMTTIGFDRDFGVPLRSVDTLYYRGELVEGTAVETRFASTSYFGKAGLGERTGQQLSDNWYLIREAETIESALASYSFSYSSTRNISLPNELVSISVTYNEATEDGSFDSDWQGYSFGSSSSLGGSESASASGSVFVQPEPIINIREGYSGPVPTTVEFFYCDPDDVNTLVSGYGSAWPVFHPESHTLVLKGQRATVRSNASASASRSYRLPFGADSGMESRDKNEGSGHSVDLQSTTSVVRIPPTIHGVVTVSGTNNYELTATASCDVGWVGTGGFPSTNASDSTTITATGGFSPSSFSAVAKGPTSVPTSGTYILDVNVSPAPYGMVRVAVEYFDASVFA